MADLFKRWPLLLQRPTSAQLSHKHSRQPVAFLCAFVSFLRSDQTLPLFVRVTSYWSEGTKYTSQF